MLDHVNTLAEKNFDWMVKLRRFFHANPELAFQEFKTSQKIQSELNRLKIAVAIHAKTGVVGFLKGKSQKPVCAIRSDMDALPIYEKTELKFMSKTPGCMHACGHDIHMATVLGAAKILRHLKKDLRGSVKFIFQPAEEEPPGGAIEIIHSAYLALDLVTFYTATGGKELRAWALRRGRSALEAAAGIHSDMARGFIRAEVIGVDELIEAGSWTAARKDGMVRQEGKSYSIADGDVLNIKFAV